MTSSVQERTQVPPHSIIRFLFGGWALQALHTAVDLKVFPALALGGQSAEALAGKLQADVRGIHTLLDALVGMELLVKQGQNYALTEPARLYLLPESGLFLGPYLEINKNLGQLWQNLTLAIQTGTSQAAVNQPEKAEAFFPHLAAAIFPMNYTSAQALAELLKVETLPEGSRVLDLAAGAAVWSIPMAQRNPKLTIDALDFPATLETARRFVEQYGVAKQYQYLPGSWQAVDIPENQYDLILLGHILHSEGWAESEKMLAKVFKALKPGGQIVIAEFMANNEKTGPLPSVLFGLNMYLATDVGQIYSEQEIHQLVTAAGYLEATRLPLPFYGPESPIMVARKPGV